MSPRPTPPALAEVITQFTATVVGVGGGWATLLRHDTGKKLDISTKDMDEDLVLAGRLYKTVRVTLSLVEVSSR